MMDFGNPDDMAWQGEVARFFIRYQGKKISCRVSREAIEDHFGDQTSDGARLDAAKANWDRITDVAADKIFHDRFEQDGTILVRSADL